MSGQEMMANRDITPLALRLFRDETARREGGAFRSAILFGSHARGDDREDSDVDVAVILSALPGSLLETKLALADVAYDVLLETGVLIQPMPLLQSHWDHPENSPCPGLIQNIHRDGVLLPP